jgi:hypothetical protein
MYTSGGWWGWLVLSLAKAAKDYYLRKLGEVSPGEDYYLRGGKATGWWCGSGAAELGLAGTVSVEGLVRLFDGQHPVTGEQLGRSLRRDGVAAWDVTFSADKSVSLLWALGDEGTRRQVLEAFEEATSQAFGYLESVASSTRGASKTPMLDDHGNPALNEKGAPRFRVETWPIATSGYMAASFTEFTSRADDPQLHTHVVVANKVKGVDGVWRTLDGRLLYRHQLAAGCLHEAVLRRELTERLGVRWQPVCNGMAGIEEEQSQHGALPRASKGERCRAFRDFQGTQYRELHRSTESTSRVSRAQIRRPLVRRICAPFIAIVPCQPIRALPTSRRLVGHMGPAGLGDLQFAIPSDELEGERRRE